MPQWSVEGANKKTGRDVTILVEAPSAAAAREVASRQGLAVASVEPSTEHATVEAAQLAYRSVAAVPSTPSFKAVRRAALTLNILAIAFYIVAAAETVGYFLNPSLTRLGAAPIASYVAASLFSSLKTVFLGAIVQAGSALLLVVADRFAQSRP